MGWGWGVGGLWTQVCIDGGKVYWHWDGSSGATGGSMSNKVCTTADGRLYNNIILLLLYRIFTIYAQKQQNK